MTAKNGHEGNHLKIIGIILGATLTICTITVGIVHSRAASAEQVASDAKQDVDEFTKEADERFVRIEDAIVEQKVMQAEDRVMYHNILKSIDELKQR